MNSSSSCSPYAPDLPDAVIHLITSSFNLKQAAQTSILSKSWNSGWLTRPIIDLDESHFPEHYRRHFNLMLFGNKTLLRYEDSNQRIHTFRLSFESRWFACRELAAEWTSKAMKMGPTDVTILLKHESNNIPIDEVFGNEDLVKLCLQSVRMDRLEVTLIKCSALKSLSLTEVRVSIDSFSNVLSCCPSIETLSLHSFKFSVDEGECVGSDPMSTISLPKLKSLVLSKIDLNQLRAFFLDGLSSKFPVLKDLTIKINGYAFDKLLVISSCSLEILNFKLSGSGWYSDRDQLGRVKLDLPSIREFSFKGHRMHNMRFSPTSGGEWDSNVSITHNDDHPNITWFRLLSDFLSNLEESKIHLALHLHGSMDRSKFQAEEITGSNAREVEDLTIYTNEGLEFRIFNSLLDGLFRICRPKKITHYADPSYSNSYRRSWDDCDGKTKSNDLLLCRALKQGLTSVMIDLPYGLRDLKEVHAEELQDEVWRPQAMDSILDDSTSKQRIVRFQLKWET